MRISLFSFLLASSVFTACHSTQMIGGKIAVTPLEKAMASYAGSLDSVLRHPEIYEVQIIYTQIDRSQNQRPQFTSYSWNLDSTAYFYPASMVKMPLALLAIEKVNLLHKPGLTIHTLYALDSLRPFQQKYRLEPKSPEGKPSIAHDIRQVFTVSDNLAYNHLFEFLGREYINQTLKTKGYNHIGILHRFNYPGRDNSWTSPITFSDSLGRTVYHQDALHDPNTYLNPQHNTLKGKGYRNATDSLIQKPFDMSSKNWFALSDMERMLRFTMFGPFMSTKSRFALTPDDRRFIWHYMGGFPRECDYPRYDSSFYDGYVKFFLFGDTKKPQNGHVRVFNKVGEAYGTLTDVAYIVDFDKKIEFILAATILCNRDGIFNDDQYDYDNVGFPFLANLGRALYQYECKRKRAVVPDLSEFKEAILSGNVAKHSDF